MPTDPPERRPFRAVAYALVLFAALILVLSGVMIWSMTDNSGTNVLSSDPQSTSPPAPLNAP
jgi:hypothetical protein